MDRFQCRMCAKYENSHNLVTLTENLMKLIDYHCRVQLITNDALPSMLCIDCETKIVDFSRYSEHAKEIQMKLVVDHQIQNVKVEIIEEHPALIYAVGQHPQLFLEEPKVEISTRSDQSDVEMDDEDGGSSGSDWKDGSSSDSEFLADIKKRIKSESPKKKRGRPKKLRSLKDVQEETLDVPESARDSNGTISKSLKDYEGKKWCDLKLNCAECQQEFSGPFELRNHYFLYHTLDLQYKCPLCPETITYFYQFLNHFHEHRKFLNFCCVICSEMFWNMKSLNHHYRDVHINADQAIRHCKRCGQYFKKPFDLANHEIRVHKMKPNREGKDMKAALYTMEYLFAEELADVNFKQNKDFEVPECDKNPDGSVTDACKNRYVNQMWSDAIYHECGDCKEIFKSPYLLYLHFNSKHSDEKPNFICKSCPEDKTFLNFEAFINHTFTIHYEHLRFFCFICSSGFWDYKALFQHYKTCHEDYNLFMCLYCGRHHKVGYELKHHLHTHNKTKFMKEEKKEKIPGHFPCNLCDKSFPKKTQLARHLEVHKKNETKIWICETCGKNFNAKSTLINHAMVHMNDKPHICTVCGEGFKNKYKLNYHRGIHTGEKNFGCEICGQRFRAKGTLKNHMFTHSGERPWACEFCDKKFSAKYDLNVHTRLHTGEYTHECSICHERYPSWSNYSKHMRGRHQIDPRSEKKKKYDALHKGLLDNKSEEPQSSQQQQYF